MTPRHPLVVANWKMHKTPAEARAFVDELRRLWGTSRPACQAALAPPFPCIAAVVEAGMGLDLPVGGQDLYWEPEGAYTGEVSGPMLAASGCQFVIVGHSERRRGFGETDAIVNKKLRAALAAGLRPILCVGETGEQRDAGATEAVLDGQLQGSLADCSGQDVAHCVLAYEPVWAIGTGKTATPATAQAAHEFLRAQVHKMFGASVAAGLRLLYGGSINLENFGALIAQADIDGGLVGGASLDPKTFATLVAIADSSWGAMR